MVISDLWISAGDDLSVGRFITFEGGEGVGKSTLVTAVATSLSTLGIDPVRTREPGGVVLAEAIRDLVLFPPDEGDWDPMSRAMLMNAARVEHLVGLIRPALKQGRWVLSDRFSDSTRVYQHIEGVGDTELAMLERLTLSETRPDITFLLDAAPEALLDRRSQRGVVDAFEAKPISFHNAVRDAFLALAECEPERVVRIDALQTPEQMCATVMTEIKRRFL